MTREERETIAIRLASIGQRLSTWCQNETYYHDKWVYSWSRLDDLDENGGDVYVFTVRVGYTPHEVLRVTSDELLGTSPDGVWRACKDKLEPLEVPEARKAEQR